MLVFYSGWGQYEHRYNSVLNQVLYDPPMYYCGLFELPKYAEKELKYKGETATDILFLSESQHPDIVKIYYSHPENYIGSARLNLCEEWEESSDESIGNQITSKIVRFTKDDIVNSPDDNKPKILTEIERHTMLKIIIGMAMYGYGYDPCKSRNAATGDKSGSIKAALEQAGLSVDSDTIRNYLNEAKELLPPKAQ